MFLLRQAARVLRIMVCYPSASMLRLLSLIAKLPLLTYVYERHAEVGEQRSGFADGYSCGRLYFAGIGLVTWRVPKGPALSAYHFYLARPVRAYLESLPTLPYRLLMKRGRVLEVGCGAGRMLGAFIDRHGGRGVGIDLYKPALEVGTVSVLGDEMEFRCLAVTRGDEITKAFSEQFAVVLFSSSLVHIPRDHGCRRKLLAALMQQSLCIVGHERNSPELREDLDAMGIPLSVTRDVINFAWQAPDA
jgi:SAM-dependent methyltransferase